MRDYTYQVDLQRVWERAVEHYRQGERDPAKFFPGEDGLLLDRIGATSQEVFDFVEDFVSSGEPDFVTFALLADIRRSYFLIHQKGERSQHVVQDADLPPKTESIAGVVWLPRILVKARAKLRGEMNPNLMFCCGGDRNFCKTNNLHPAEFLRLVADHIDDDQPIIDYVVRKAAAAPAS